MPRASQPSSARRSTRQCMPPRSTARGAHTDDLQARTSDRSVAVDELHRPHPLHPNDERNRDRAMRTLHFPLRTADFEAPAALSGLAGKALVIGAAGAAASIAGFFLARQ